MHGFDAGIAFDGDNTRGLALRNDAVLIVDAAEERGVERLEAVLILTGDGDRGLIAMTCARSENIRPSSACGSSEVRRESSRRLRMRSPRCVPPGWRVVTTASSRRTSHSCSLRNCVDLPEPSSPSNVRKKPRGMAGV